MSVIFAGGGTIGSITSLAPLIEQLSHRHGIKCHFFAPRGSQGREIVEKAGATWDEIPAAKLTRYPSVSWLFIIPNIIRGYVASGKLLDSYDASVVVTSGSFVSPPVVWRARRKGIKIVLLQLDILMGLANRLIVSSATKCFFSFDTSEVERGTVIGPIVRGHTIDMSHVSMPSKFDHTMPVIFITGGGTGAQMINEMVWNALPQLTERANIVHSAGRGKQKRYAHKRYLQQEFFDADNYYYWLEKADIVIGRSGMGFFSDCIAYKKAVITIPIFGSHQEINARYFADRSTAIMPSSKASCTEQWLLDTIDRLFSDRNYAKSLGDALGRFHQKDSVQILVSAIQQLHGKSD